VSIKRRNGSSGSSALSPGASKVVGQTKYAVDIYRDGMLFAALVRSPHAHARIVGVDAGPALALDGVLDAITADDLPDRRYGPYIQDQPILARQKVRYVGEPVAAIAAVDEKTARMACSLVSVSYDKLPALFSPLDSLGSDAYVHDRVEDYVANNQNLKRHGNVCMEMHLARGDVEAAFAICDRVFEGSYQTQAVHPLHMEPHAAIAEWTPDGRLTVWSSAQEPFVARDMLAHVLDVPKSDVRVVAPPLGGGFGGKEAIRLEPICSELARRTRRPVKITLTLEEELGATSPRPPMTIRIKTGVMLDGTIVVRDADILCDSGAYGYHAIGEASYAALTVVGPYKMQAASAKAQCVYTNNLSFGCIRGYGVTHATFASEVQLDEIARELGMDPLDLRRRNAAQEGDVEITGQPLTSVTLASTLEAAAQAANWSSVRARGRSVGRGFGVACAYKGIGAQGAKARVDIGTDGRATVHSGTIDFGTETQTGLGLIAAEGLGIPPGMVTVSLGDTATGLFDIGSVGSRVLHDAGQAVLLAVADVLEQIAEHGAKLLGVGKADVAVENGAVTTPLRPGVKLSFAAVAEHASSVQKRAIVGTGTYKNRNLGIPGAGTSSGYVLNPMNTYAFATHIAEVEVDVETGKVRVVQVVAAHDVGRALDMSAVKGQIEGGVAMGVGAALSEELVMREGRVLNPNMIDYRVLTALDMPTVTPLVLESQDQSGPFGAKGIGELPYLPIVPAIINAIRDAVGTSPHKIPVTPERLLAAMDESRQSVPPPSTADPKSAIGQRT